MGHQMIRKEKCPYWKNCFNCGSCDNYRTGLDSNYRRYSGCRTGNGVNYHCWSILHWFIAGAAIAIVGISLVISGSVILLPQTAAGLALIGSGLIIMVLGVVATVGFGKLCEVVLRGLAKGMKYLWEKISHRKVVA